MSTWRVIHGDCLEVLKSIPAGSVDAVVTDPPYGIAWDVGINPYGNLRKAYGKEYKPIVGDDRPFDPSPWLALNVPTVLWGANHYSNKLPPSGAWLTWDKRMHVASTDQSDCELAWSNVGNRARMIRYLFHGGGSIAKENGTAAGRGVPVSLHPTQKPVVVMVKCLEFATKPGDTVLDPFCGSGTTGVACMQTGRNFIGVEIDAGYCEIARRRISEAANTLWTPEPKETQPEMFK